MKKTGVTRVAKSNPTSPSASAAVSAGTSADDGERLLRAVGGFAAQVEPATISIEQINALLEASPVDIDQRFGTAEDFFVALQLRLAEGRLTYVTDRAGPLSPGVERIRLALTTYLDFTFQHRGVARLCAKARLQHRRLADQIQQRESLVALMISLELNSLKCRNANECARLIQATLSDVANNEMMGEVASEKLRSNLMGCVQALIAGFSTPA